MTPLAQLLRETIRREGPLTVARYMAEAVGHPEHGYYARRDPLGKAGDFVTAPEVSQMFGELIGLWCVDCWTRLGQPAPVMLVELGPGRGTLMADALRAATIRPAFRDSIALHLVETSEVLRRGQAEALGQWHPSWHARIEDVPPGPMLLVANEFFDALPVHQFERTAEGWRERMVGLAPQPGQFAFTLADGPPTETLPDPAEAPIGALVEVAPRAAAIAETIGRRLATGGGAALIVDYGHDSERSTQRAWTGTLQAVRGQRYDDPLADPGEVDITAHVDFGALRRAAMESGAAVYGPIAQGAFLEALGIAERAARLARDASPSAAATLALGLHRLIAPSAMGRLFQALAIAHPVLGTPSGFAGPAPVAPPVR